MTSENQWRCCRCKKITDFSGPWERTNKGWKCPECVKAIKNWTDPELTWCSKCQTDKKYDENWKKTNSGWKCSECVKELDLDADPDEAYCKGCQKTHKWNAGQRWTRSKKSGWRCPACTWKVNSHECDKCGDRHHIDSEWIYDTGKWFVKGCSPQSDNTRCPEYITNLPMC